MRWTNRLATLAIAGLAACSSAGPSLGDEAVGDDPVARYNPEPSFLKEFSDGHDNKWFRSDFVYINNVQRAGWEADHVIFDDKGVELMITKEP